MQKLPPVSIIVPLGKKSELDTLVDSILSLDYPQFELILAYKSDDGIKDTLSKIVMGNSMVRAISVGPGNPSRLRNIGMIHSKFDLLAFIDSDCMPQRDWLHQLVSTKIRLGYRVVVGATRSANSHESQWARVAAERYAVWLLGALQNDRLTRLDTKNLLIEKDFLISLGSFDENLDSKEDRDLSLRIQRSGKSIGFASQATLNHKDPENLGEVYRRAVWYSRGMRQFRAKHHAPFIPRRRELIFYKRYIGESIWALFSMLLLTTTAVIALLGILQGYLILILLLGGLVALGMAFRSLIGSLCRLALRRSTKEDFIFDLISDLGHKVGYISAMLWF